MIRVGVVGFGLAGRVFHAPLISSVDRLQLAAVVERSTSFAAERYPGTATYRTVEEMLADKSLDLIVVASPSATHFDVARQVIAAGKHVVVDKPVATSSTEIAQLIALAAERGVTLVPFHNRRWDGDYLTVEKLLREGAVGRLVSLESRMDRWNPGATRRAWKNDPAQGGGVLLDLGTHLVYLALALFGKPLGVSAEVERERDGEGANDAFTIRLRYDELRVTLGSNMLSAAQPPRWVLRGTEGCFRKSGVDPQEAALNKITRIDSPQWGQEPREQWGLLSVQTDGALVTQPVETIAGNYRRFYEGVRDALLGQATPPVSAVEAWRAARILEWAKQSSEDCREIVCDWSGEPA
jgi:predicted dehydrogenase